MTNAQPQFKSPPTDVEEYRNLLYEKYVLLLVKHLNQVHQENHGRKYWELIVGPWLKIFLYHTHYRYQRLGLSKAPDKEPISKRLTLPYDFVSFVYLFEKTDYPKQLDALLSGSTDVKQIQLWESLQISSEQARRSSTIKRHIKDLILWILSMIFSSIGRRGKIAMVSPSVKLKSIFKIWWVSKFRITPLFLKRIMKTSSPIYPDFRKWPRAAEDVNKNDSFDCILRKILLLQLPQVHLEDYASLKRQATKLPSDFRVVFSSMGWHQDELFKIFSAVEAEKGAKLIGHQHGGVYGLAKTRLPEYEASVTDLFLTWGWNGSSKMRPFVSLKLSETVRCLHRLPKHPQEILFVSSTGSRHLPDGWGCPSGEQIHHYWNLQLQFLRALDESARDTLVMRLYPGDFYGWEHDLRPNYLGLKIRLKNSDSLVEAFSKAKLAIFDNNLTTFLESYACDVPTVTFFDDNLWPLHERAIPLFEEMERVGLFHKNLESAARHVNQIYQNPRAWWDDAEVKKIRDEFRNRFARTSPTFVQEIVDLLLSECRK